MNLPVQVGRDVPAEPLDHGVCPKRLSGDGFAPPIANPVGRVCPHRAACAFRILEAADWGQIPTKQGQVGESLVWLPSHGRWAQARRVVAEHRPWPATHPELK